MILLVLLHVTIALSSIGYATGLIFAPVARRFKTAYGLIAATLVSGVGLVLASHSDLLSACRTGIAYLVVVSVALAIAQRRLAYEEQ